MALVSLDKAKAWLSITGTDQDALLAEVLESASEACATELSRGVEGRRYTDKLSGTGARVMPVNNPPVAGITAVKIDGKDMPISDYTFDEISVIARSGPFPIGLKNIEITYSGGFSTIPAPIVTAVLFTVKAMWDAKTIDMNATSESFPGVGGNGFWPTGPGAIPPAAQTLLNRFKLRGRMT